MNNPMTGIMLILTTLSLSLGIFMNVLDVSIANVAIPYIAGDLGISPNQGTWVITSFAVSEAIMLPITGWIAKQWGEVRVFVVATALFTLASVLCGLAYTFPMLILCRVLQGIAAGPMIPLSQSILLSIYPEQKKGFATSIWGTTAVVAPILGPIFGGWLTYNYAWPWIFYINLPVGALCVIITIIVMRGRETPLTKLPSDFVGLFLLVIGIGSLQILLDKGNDLDWFHSSMIAALSIISVIAITLLIIWEWMEAHPVIDLTLFTRRNFTLGAIALSFGYLVFFSNVVIFPLWLQTQMGYTAIWAGLAAAPVGILSFFFSPIVGSQLHRVDLRWIASFGFVVFALVSFWNASFNTGVDFSQLVMPRFFQGIGIACFFTPLMMIVISGLPRERVASALGLANFLRIIGSSFGTSLSVTLWERREQFHHSRLVEQINHANPWSLQTVEYLRNTGLSSKSAYEQLDAIVTHQAFMLSTNDIFWLSGALFLCLLIILWFTRPPFITS